MEEILFWCRQVGCRIGETPILFENRRAGTSKINNREVIRALEIILQLGLGQLVPGSAGGLASHRLVIRSESWNSESRRIWSIPGARSRTMNKLSAFPIGLKFTWAAMLFLGSSLTSHPA